MARRIEQRLVARTGVGGGAWGRDALARLSGYTASGLGRGAASEPASQQGQPGRAHESSRVAKTRARGGRWTGPAARAQGRASEEEEGGRSRALTGRCHVPGTATEGK